MLIFDFFKLPRHVLNIILCYIYILARKRHEEAFHSALDRSEFYAMADLTTQPVLFSPTYEGEESSNRVRLSLWLYACMVEYGIIMILATLKQNVKTGSLL